MLSKDGSINFVGSEVGVVALEVGPSLVWAEPVAQADWNLGRAATRLPWGGGDACPEGTQQVIRVTWEGGVTLPGGAEVDDSIRQAYQVTVGGSEAEGSKVTPFALADMGDSDNNHLLCLDVTEPTLAVSFPTGLVTDPNEDLNPATRVDVVR